MKKIIIIFISTIVWMGAFQSCNFLDETLPDSYSRDDFYKNDAEAAKALYGTYAAVKDVVFGTDFVSVTDLMCDDMDFVGTDQARRQLNGLNFDTRNKYFVNVWAKLWVVVNNANLLIDNVSKMDTLTQTSKDNKKIIIAEAKVLRAWSYLMLVQLWGDVPKITEPTYDVKGDIRPGRAPAADIYELIIKDLTEAEGAMFDKPSFITIRPGTDIKYDLALTRGAARLLMAKAYLAQKKYPECLKAVQYLIDRFADDGSKTYSLIDYANIFNVDHKNDKNRKQEVIWEIESLAQSGYNNSANRDFLPSATFSSVATTGYQNYMPSTSLFEAFSRQSQDKRFAANYRISTKGPFIFKRVDFNTTDQNMGAPVEVLLRSADAVLVYAEALNATGNTEEAIVWINKIRDRAGLISSRVVIPGMPPIITGNIKPGTSQQVVQDTIINERRMEFAHECQRLFDLRRTGKLMQALKAYNEKQNYYLNVKSINFGIQAGMDGDGSPATVKTLNVPFVPTLVKNLNDRILLHPIPEDEIRSNSNLLPNNHGYN
ncbi:MAG: RagB/SusD family nutrient uptake outer membrane protein [Candidatus Azobacteroides sp.]|nr:RagB/SusD family nutrient uptake outer membrane protein [Candidatus Azobacteroides sp.]